MLYENGVAVGMKISGELRVPLNMFKFRAFATFTNQDITSDYMYKAEFTRENPIFMEVSEPVPVTARNPAAMLMGFQLGTAIRRMRGKAAPDITDAELVDGVLYIRNAVATLNQNVLEVV